jgi:O-antigen/teichoic acid export membrane protein
MSSLPSLPAVQPSGQPPDLPSGQPTQQPAQPTQPAHAAGAVRWSFLFSFAEKYTLLVLGMAGAMVVSRLLTPAEIGVYSVGAVLAGLAQVVRDFGVGPYVIQEKELTTDKLRAALSTSLMVSWLLAAVVALSSGIAADFYREPRLRTVLRLLAINFVLIPFSSVTLPYLRRHLRFYAIYTINAVNSLAQLICTVSLAWLGMGYLSLVWGAVGGALAGLLASLCFRPRSLPWLPGRRGLRQILSFGALSTAGGMVDEIGVAAPDLIIGKLIGVAEVGMFGKAMGVLNVFNQLVTSAISPVIFPLFSAQVRAGHDLQQAYLRTAAYMSGLAWPFFGVLGIMAPQVVRVLYGEQWDAAVPLIRIICASSALYSMFSMARYLFVAMGHVKAQAQLDAGAVPVRVIAVLLAAPFGLAWVAWAVVLGAVFRSWLTYRYLAGLTGIGWRQLLAAGRRSLVLALACMAGPLALQTATSAAGDHPLPALLVVAMGSSLLWLVLILLLRHELAGECRLAGRKAWSLLARWA